MLTAHVVSPSGSKFFRLAVMRFEISSVQRSFGLSFAEIIESSAHYTDLRWHISRANFSNQDIVAECCSSRTKQGGLISTHPKPQSTEQLDLRSTTFAVCSESLQASVSDDRTDSYSRPIPSIDDKDCARTFG